jgi:Flp pilus assembly protein TadG
MPFRSLEPVRNRRGVTALAALLIMPALFMAAGLAVDAGHLYLETQKVKGACQAAALSAFGFSMNDVSQAGDTGTAALRLAGLSQGTVTVTLSAAAGQAPVATATAQGVTVKTVLSTLLSGGSWEWTLSGIQAKATRKPLIVSLVMDASGSMCNTRPVSPAKPYLDAGDGMLPQQFYQDLANAGGLNFLTTKTASAPGFAPVTYKEVPTDRMWSAARFRSCTSQTNETWIQDYVREAKTFVRSYLVEGYDKAGIVTFNWGAYEKRAVLPVSYSDIDSVLDSIQAEGPTNLAAGIRQATDQILLASTPGEGRRDIILFTEGGANVMHARFTDVSSAAQATDKAYRYDRNSPSPGGPYTPPSYVVPASTAVLPGMGSIYADGSQPPAKEYVVLINSSPFDQWVFEKKNASDPEISFNKLQLAACSGPNYLHKYNPFEPARGMTYPAPTPREPGEGWITYPTASRPVIYGTYAMERCFDSYNYLDWDGVQHAGDPGQAANPNAMMPVDFRMYVNPQASPSYNPDDNSLSYPASGAAGDPFYFFYRNQAGAKKFNVGTQFAVQPMQMAIYEANRAKSPPNNISVHTLSYGFKPVSGGWHNVFAADYFVNGYDHLSVKRGANYPAGSDHYVQGFLPELTNHVAHSVYSTYFRNPMRKYPAVPGGWETQARGISVAFTPVSGNPASFGFVNTPENDAKFSQHAKSFFGYITRQSASLVSAE